MWSCCGTVKSNWLWVNMQKKRRGSCSWRSYCLSTCTSSSTGTSKQWYFSPLTITIIRRRRRKKDTTSKYISTGYKERAPVSLPPKTTTRGGVFSGKKDQQRIIVSSTRLTWRQRNSKYIFTVGHFGTFFHRTSSIHNILLLLQSKSQFITNKSIIDITLWLVTCC